MPARVIAAIFYVNCFLTTRDALNGRDVGFSGGALVGGARMKRPVQNYIVKRVIGGRREGGRGARLCPEYAAQGVANRNAVFLTRKITIAI
jgi:hypothetical protein